MKNFSAAVVSMLTILLFGNNLPAQKIHEDILNKIWKASWIAVPGEPAREYGVYHFRKSLELSTAPASFVVHVSADNRYKLYVNGYMVSLGPARSDLYHWNFETVDIAQYLRPGKNSIAAIVWNDGEDKPEAQISSRTAFILQGNTDAESAVNTDKSWKCIRDKSHRPLAVKLIYSYYVAGPGELVDMNDYQPGWMNAGFNDSNWSGAAELFHGLPKGVFDWTTGWMLVPRTIPQMEFTTQRLAKVRKAEGISLPESFPAKKTAITVPPNSTITLLLDQAKLTNAYPTIIFSKGDSAALSLRYAEALYVDEGSSDWRRESQKGNRDEVEGKRFVGKQDSIISNGNIKQEFTALWYRTYRYLQLKVETKSEPLVIDDVYGTFSGYPFEMKATFNAGDNVLDRIMQTGWHTARLCAMETYMDCPYYEQLQYVGDTRIQALVSLYNSGDDRMMRNAITLLDNSRMAEGITLSRYPTANAQEIPTFSLWWIGMLHDCWMYRNDKAFVQQHLQGMRTVLNFFSKYQQADGALKNPPYWNFTDWCSTKGWSGGTAPIGKNGTSSVLDLQLLWAYQLAAQLESETGMKEYAAIYNAAAGKLKQSIKANYWDAGKQLLADTQEKDVYSQHANTLAILTGLITGDDARKLADKIMTDKLLTEATIYFKYYVHLALTKAGYGNNYLQWLDIWRQNFDMGMSTWAEMSDINRSRSDCHAWGSSPNIEFFRIVLGIDSDAPGFGKVKIEPHLGQLKNAEGEMPHPNGKIKVKYQYGNDGKLKASVLLPTAVSGNFVWKGKTYPLKTGVETNLSL
ncbi:alpha-L-rhamnosidase-related protein [Foetidibacter luteolus]|uniref:alpha-L-rhamnosidase-related protein n=1 Tax=Foetidibacter luteolus TaxID=2608880 RepID=UPI00129BD459|nr:alpha-L-rhamnosidase N-terminal domain-containing protein [Foetidibacter luteolus]